MENKVLKARGGLSTGLNHSDPRNGRNGFIRRKNAQCGLEMRGSTSADLRQKALCWFVVAEGVPPARIGAFRRVFDSFSLFTRSTFGALSFVFRLFLVRFSFGLR